MLDGEPDVEKMLSCTEIRTPVDEPVNLRLIASVKVSPHKSVIAPVYVQGHSTGTVMLEPCRQKNQSEVSQSLLNLSET